MTITPHRWCAAWQISWRLFSWGYPACALIAFVLIVVGVEAGFLVIGGEQARLVELIVPLVLAVQTALVFSPDDEPALELLLAAPRPLWWLLLERLAVVVGVYVVLALGMTALLLWLKPLADPVVALLRWLPPAAFLGGLALLVTLRTRKAALGALLAGTAWFTLAFFHQYFAPGAPPLPIIEAVQNRVWPIHAYMQPEYMTQGAYWLNRALVTLIGTGLVGLAVWELRKAARWLL